MRPAPAQATYLGFPGTLGLPYVDYLIADHGAVPDENAQHFTEKVLRLSSCYLPRDLGVLPEESFPSKADFELPESAFVFCSFNHEYKITPSIFGVWMELLSEVPASVLWLMRQSEETQANIRSAAQARGVDPARIIFAKRVPRVEDHLARYRHADLCLDTFPYNGHTTTSDALFMGAPVVTRAGTSFASRVATSLLRDVGLDAELSCNSLAAYKDKAKELATNPQKLSEIRSAIKGCGLEFWRANAQRQAAEFSDLVCGM
jgi:predicted O-linked N-acetylglucosamine transferase (SPINDLY family)